MQRDQRVASVTRLFCENGKTVYDARKYRDFSVDSRDGCILFKFYDRQEPNVKAVWVNLFLDDAEVLARHVLALVKESSS